MMRVTVEIVPGGDESSKRTIASIDVWNTTSLSDISDYRFVADLEGERVPGRVFGHERAFGWIPLVRRVLHVITSVRKDAGR